MKKTYPKIGMRILKSALAVFICLSFNVLRNGEGIVFYSCIAAILCMQHDFSTSFQTAFNRMIGTLHGGLMGLFVLLIIQNTVIRSNIWLRYVVLSCGIIFVIYFTLIYRKQKVSYISCVVFLSITVSHGLDVNPYLFALNRMLDTGIGIIVALFLNHMHIPFYRMKSRLYLVSWDCLLNQQGEIDEYAKIKLKQFIERKGNILFFGETPIVSHIQQIGIPLKHPSFLIDTFYQENQDLYQFPMEPLRKIIGEKDCFTFQFVEDMVYGYYDGILSTCARKWMKELRKNEFFAFVKQSSQQSAFLLIQFGEKEILEKKRACLVTLEEYKQCKITVISFMDTNILIVADQALCLKNQLLKVPYLKQYDEIIVFANQDYFQGDRFYLCQNKTVHQIIRELYRDARRKKKNV